MIERILILFCGLGLIYSGIEVIRTGRLFVKGIYSEYPGFNVPVGIVFIVVGAFLIFFSVWRNRKKKKEGQ
jgi:hypothetical protein